jgi:hypothetical protein
LHSFINIFLFYARQILADKLIKNCPYYRVKWIGINKQGCTWESKEHFQGEKSLTILKFYLVKKQAELVAAENRKYDMLAVILVETGMAESSEVDEENIDGKVADDKHAKAENSRQRVNESPCRHHFGKWFWDNSVPPAAKRATCLLCQKRFQRLARQISVLISQQHTKTS